MNPKPLPWYFKPIAPVLTRFLQWLESRGLLKFPRHLSTKVAATITQQFLADKNANDDVVSEYVHSMEDEVEKHPRPIKPKGAKGKPKKPVKKAASKKKSAKKAGKKSTKKPAKKKATKRKKK
ncbi:MAG: hypothetical protein H6617_12095 [Bdellovibrionaceae bacterium]|nr:hypothetical protein [Pseudobdellovibrionaceae bacterium]